MNSLQSLSIGTVSLALFGAACLGCAVNCIEDGRGTTCTAKSLKKYEGTPAPTQAFDHTPGAPINVDVLYGNVHVARSGSGKIEVEIKPFVYAAYDAEQRAFDEIKASLRTGAVAAQGVVVTVQREGGSNGLGADVTVRVPDQFDGTLAIVNRGGGPINAFDVRVEAVGQASAVQITNQATLGTCWLAGAPSVRTTTVQCGNTVSVFDVAASVTISNGNRSHGDASPAITLRMAGVGGSGGSISAATGSISATFPAAGGYVLTAQAAGGVVQEGALPARCRKSEASAASKTIACGEGPTYALSTGGSGGPKAPANVLLAYR